MQKLDLEIRFVARHYRRGAFSPREGWRRLGLGASPVLRRRIAASLAAMVVLSAAAAIYIHSEIGRREAALPAASSAPEQAPAAALSLVIEFTDAPLTDVVAEIESVYGVSVGNVPADAADMRLTLRYEGTAAGLIECINELEATAMIVEEP